MADAIDVGVGFLVGSKAIRPIPVPSHVQALRAFMAAKPGDEMTVQIVSKKGKR